MIIGYARVSTEDQELKLQIDALEKFGCEHIVTEKASGKTVNRPTFRSILDHGIRPGDTLVVWKLDRLGRTLSGVVQVIEQLNNNNVDVVSITDGFDVRTPMGKAMMQITLVFAELERNLISERTRAGMAAAKAEGKILGRKRLIEDYPKRMKFLQKTYDAGKLVGEEGQLLWTRDALRLAINNADKKAPAIKGNLTIKRWQDAGFPGVDRGENNEEG